MYDSDNKNKCFDVIKLEYIDGNLFRLYKGSKDSMSLNDWKSILFQILCAIFYLFSKLNISHNDTYPNNIFYKNVKTTELCYEISGKKYSVPTYGKLYMVGDFGKAKNLKKKEINWDLIDFLYNLIKLIANYTELRDLDIPALSKLVTVKEKKAKFIEFSSKKDVNIRKVVTNCIIFDSFDYSKYFTDVNLSVINFIKNIYLDAKSNMSIPEIFKKHFDFYKNDDCEPVIRDCD